MKLKNLKDITFDINSIGYSFAGTDEYILAENAKIKSAIMVKNGKLKITVVDKNNSEGNFYIKAKNQDGQTILNTLLLSDKLVDVPVKAFERLELDYFE